MANIFDPVESVGPPMEPESSLKALLGATGTTVEHRETDSEA
jgi:hypothetical protein